MSIVTPDLIAAVSARVTRDGDVAAAPADRAVLRRVVARALAAEGVVVAPAVWASTVRDLVDELGGLGVLEGLLRDPDVTDVMVNGADEIYVDRGGALERAIASFRDEAHLTEVVARVLGPMGVRFDRGHPWADAVLPGGVRLHALLPPLAATTTVTLRRVAALVPTWEHLREQGTVPRQVAGILGAAVVERRNLVIAGRAGVGKTTLLARLVTDVGGDRVVIIEDAPELAATGVHAVHLRTRPASADGAGAVDVADLLRNALRMRPDRIVVGEVRGREVADMLQAMNTGHAGSMTTVHANGASDALVRIEGMALLAGVPIAAARAQIGSAIDVVVALGRDRDGGRVVTEIAEVVPGRQGPQLRELWRRHA